MSFGFTPAPAPASLGVHVVSELRRLIIAGQIAPGTRLVEAKLSLEFKTSRGPIRDALRTLESENLVEALKNASYVVGLSVRDLDELYGLRGLIELEALKLSAAAPEPDWSEVRAALARMQSAAAHGDPEELGSADLDFHSAFYLVAGQRRLETVWSQYRPTFGVLLSLSNAEGAPRLSNTVSDHEILFEAVRSGDLDDVVRTFEAHNTESLRRMRSFLGHSTGADASSGELPHGGVTS